MTISSSYKQRKGNSIQYIQEIFWYFFPVWDNFYDIHLWSPVHRASLKEGSILKGKRLRLKSKFFLLDYYLINKIIF